MPFDYYLDLNSRSSDNNSRSGKLLPCYYWPLRWTDITSEDYEILKQVRKDAVKAAENWAPIQKTAWKDNIELARFAKEEVKFWQRIQKACTLMEPYFNNEKRDCIPSTLWPEGLATELDVVSAVIEVKRNG